MSRLGQGEGPLDAQICIVGRDWGTTETRLRRPFVGRAGSILDRALATAGILRSHCRIENVAHIQPPDNDFERHQPGDVEEGIARLHEYITTHQPKIVIALGNEAFRAVLGVSPEDKGALPSITDARGYLWDSPLGPRVLSTIHPAACDRQWVPWRALLDVDLTKAKRELELGCPAFPERRVEIVTSPDVVLPSYPADWVSLDIENDSDLKLSCLGVATEEHRAIVIPAFEPWQMDMIRNYCEADTEKILQNGQYDRYFLQHKCDPPIIIKNQTFDTMLAFHALEPELAGKASKKKAKRTQKSLRFLASVYTREPFWKDYDFASFEDRAMLCGKDVCLTLEIGRKLKKELEDG